MEQNKEIQELINAFKGYRDVLSPILINLHELVDTYGSMENDLEKLGVTLSSDTKNKLDQIYETLSSQAKKSTDLSANIDQFIRSSNKYTNEVTHLYNSFEQIENKLTTVNELEMRAREQLKRLDEIIEEKKINYNIKELQRSLENYNNNVQKVSEFINKDVAAVLTENTKKIDAIKKDSDEFSKRLADENLTIETLVETYKTTNNLLEKTVQKEDVNEEYIFAILDKWATSRRVKIKR